MLSNLPLHPNCLSSFPTSKYDSRFGFLFLSHNRRTPSSYVSPRRIFNLRGFLLYVILFFLLSSSPPLCNLASNVEIGLYSFAWLCMARDHENTRLSGQAHLASVGVMSYVGFCYLRLLDASGWHLSKRVDLVDYANG